MFQGRPDIEARIQTIGHELFAAVHARRPRPPSRAWFDEVAMAATMRDDAVKVQLFRFVDALPGLRDDAAINRHIAEYLAPVAERLPRIAGAVFRACFPGRDPHGARDAVTGAVAAWVANQGARALAHRFIAGADPAAAVAAVSHLRANGLAATVDLLGEAVLGEDEADAYAQVYVDLITGLTGAARTWGAKPVLDRDHHGAVIPGANVSLKLSALTGRFEPCDPVGTSRRVRERLRPLLRLARAQGAFVNIDMEQSGFKDCTLRILADVAMEDEFRAWPDLGIAIQAYLLSCPDDLAFIEELAIKRGTPLWVRLVKGAYWDHETVLAAHRGWPAPVHLTKAATDAAYERLTVWLLDRVDLVRPAFASHNVRSISHVIAQAEARKLPPGAREFQVLHGMSQPLQAALAARGERVRVYAPCGALLPGMAYLVRRLLENTSNQSFVRAAATRTPEEVLLMDPLHMPVEVSAEKTVPSTPTGPIRLAPFANTPPLDFTTAAEQDAFQAALTAGAADAGRDHPLVIGGAPVVTGDWLAVWNPSHNDRLVGRAACAGPKEANAAVAAAAAAFPAWRDTPAAIRSAVVRKLASILGERRRALAALMVMEAGKTWTEADADVAEAIDFCNYYAEGAEDLARPRRRDLPGEENDLIYEPRGVAVVIAPWNFPLAILTGMTVAALATGNTAVMKPAEQTPLIAAALMDACAGAGFPAGVVNFLPGRGEIIGPVLIAHPATALVAFTGSLQVGLDINRAATAAVAGRDHVVRVIAEMGGKNAIIVDSDADLDEAVAGVARSAFGYQGQKCSACSRVIVLEAVHDRFVARLQSVLRGWECGPAEDPGHLVGPLIDGEAKARVLAAISRGKTEANLAFAGAGPDSGHYVGPHLFTDVAADSFLDQEEIFGPVLAVMKARDLDHALAIANGTRYALTGGCYSRSPATLSRVRRDFRVGNLYLNRGTTGALVGRQPFGGFKLSGIGSKAGGPDYLLQFVIPRAICENTERHGFAVARDEA